MKESRLSSKEKQVYISVINLMVLSEEKGKEAKSKNDMVERNRK